MFTFFCAVILAHTEPDSTGATVLMFAFVCAIFPAHTKPARLAIAWCPWLCCRMQCREAFPQNLSVFSAYSSCCSSCCCWFCCWRGCLSCRRAHHLGVDVIRCDARRCGECGHLHILCHHRCFISLNACILMISHLFSSTKHIIKPSCPSTATRHASSQDY